MAGFVGWSVRVVFDAAKIARKVDDANARGLYRAAALVRIVARRSIKKKPRGVSSRPGEVPYTHRSDSGPDYALRESIRFDVDRDALSAVIGPAFSSVRALGEMLEFGRRWRRTKYKPRPFMGPALTAAEVNIPKEWRGTFHD